MIDEKDVRLAELYVIDGDLVRVQVPFAIRRRGGRKLVVVPATVSPIPERSHVDNAMIKALARAFRWRKLLETGAFGTIEELAAAEKINPSYVSRILRLTLLSPDIVEAILDGTQSPVVTLATMMRPFPADWWCQRTFCESGAKAGAKT